jgi:hypothetical protein
VIFDNLHMTHDIISDILTADTIPHEQKGRMIDQQLDKLQDPTRDTMSLDEWKMMADHMGGVEVMGGRATDLVELVQAPAAAMTGGGEMQAMPGMTPDSGGMAHDMGQMGQPMQGMAHDSMSPSMAAHMAAMMALHERMMADPVIRQRIMSDSVTRGLMAQMMDSAGAAGRPGAQKPSGAKKHEGHGEQMKKPAGRKPPRAKPPAPAPRPAKPDSSAMPSHDQHSAGTAAGSGRTR